MPSTSKESSVDKVAAALEDISIKPAPPENKLYVLPSAPEEKLTDLDAKTVLLLGLVDDYQRLADTQRLHYVNGFLNLSRANYNSGLRKYGPGSFDLRPYMAVKNVDIEGDQFKIQNKLANQRISDKQARENEKTDKELSSEKTEIVSSDSSGLRNRKERAIFREGTVEVSENRLRDPILQFGALVPYQLRQSQQFFVDGLQSLVQILNLRKRILTLVLEIEELETRRVEGNIDGEVQPKKAQKGL